MLKIVLIILPLALLALVLMLVMQNSRIPKNLGVHEGRLAPLPFSPNAVSSQTEKIEQQVAPLPFIRDLQQTKKALLLVIDSYSGQQVQIVYETDTYVHCVFSTTNVGFKDDVEFFLDAEKKVVHFRSASRLGYSDMGLNRNRYDTLASMYLRRN